MESLCCTSVYFFMYHLQPSSRRVGARTATDPSVAGESVAVRFGLEATIVGVRIDKAHDIGEGVDQCLSALLCHGCPADG